jgi:hypothetical protein
MVFEVDRAKHGCTHADVRLAPNHDQRLDLFSDKRLMQSTLCPRRERPLVDRSSKRDQMAE